MARALRIQYPGAFYHVTCRGNAQKAIFDDDSDRLRFVKLLAESLELYQVILYVYVLMDNHFHLVIQTQRANLSEFMRRFNICYTGWFNHRHKRCGHLYQGRYHALLVDADNYLLEVSRYGHLNPARIKKFQKWSSNKRWSYIQRYQWSSLPGYLNKKAAVEFVDYNLVLEMIGGRRAYTAFLRDGLAQKAINPLKDAQYGIILGDKDFVDRIKADYIEKGSAREQPMYRKMMGSSIDASMLIASVIKSLDISFEEIRMFSGNGVQRGIVAELLYRYSNITQAEIGKYLGGIDYSAVSRLRSRLRSRMVPESEVRRKFKQAEMDLAKLSNVKI